MIQRTIILFLLLCVTFAVAQTPEDFQTKGNTLFEAGDFAAAIVEYEEAIKLDPTYAPAIFQIALSYLRLGEMDKTREYITQAIEADQENQEYRESFDEINEINTGMNDGNRAYRSGLYDDAITSYQHVLDKFPFFAEAAFSLGSAYLQLGNQSAALENFNLALELNNSHENARTAISNVAKQAFNEGNKCYKRRDLDCAIENYLTVIDIDSSFYQAYYQIGVIEAKRGNNTYAIENYKKALKQNPAFYKGWFALGLVQKKDGDVEGAMASLQRTVDILPNYVKAYGAMADIYIEQKNYDKAISVLSTATTLDATYHKGFLKLGMVYIELGDHQKAADNLVMATSLDDDSHSGWYLLAQSFNELGECDKAEDAALHATDLKERFGGGWYELANAEWCKGKGNKTAALNHLEKARNDRTWRKSAEYLMDKIKNPQKYQDN